MLRTSRAGSLGTCPIIANVFSIWISCSRMCEAQRPRRKPTVTGKPDHRAPALEPIVRQARKALGAEVEDGVEARTEVVEVASRLGRGLVGHRGPEGVGYALRQCGVVRVMVVRLPPGRAPSVCALARDDVSEGQADRPLPSSWIGVEERVVERNQDPVEIPPCRGRRPDDPRSTSLAGLRRSDGSAGLDFGLLERLGSPVGAVADLLLAATLPGPGLRQRRFRDRQQSAGGGEHVGPGRRETGLERSRERWVGVVEQGCVER